jgi:hypothetical protein
MVAVDPLDRCQHALGQRSKPSPELLDAGADTSDELHLDRGRSNLPHRFDVLVKRTGDEHAATGERCRDSPRGKLGDVDPQPDDGLLVLGAFDDLASERSAAANEQHRLDAAAQTQPHQRSKIRRGGRRDADESTTGEIIRCAAVVPQQLVRPAHGCRGAPDQPAAVGTKQNVEVTGVELAVRGRNHGGRTRVVMNDQVDVVVARPQLEADRAWRACTA